MRMTREEFDHWLRTRAGAEAVRVAEPFDVLPCFCKQSGCLGWRLVSIEPPIARDYEPFVARPPLAQECN